MLRQEKVSELSYKELDDNFRNAKIKTQTIEYTSDLSSVTGEEGERLIVKGNGTINTSTYIRINSVWEKQSIHYEGVENPPDNIGTFGDTYLIERTVPDLDTVELTSSGGETFDYEIKAVVDDTYSNIIDPLFIDPYMLGAAAAPLSKIIFIGPVDSINENEPDAPISSGGISVSKGYAIDTTEPYIGFTILFETSATIANKKIVYKDIILDFNYIWEAPSMDGRFYTAVVVTLSSKRDIGSTILPLSSTPDYIIQEFIDLFYRVKTSRISDTISLTDITDGTYTTTTTITPKRNDRTFKYTDKWVETTVNYVVTAPTVQSTANDLEGTIYILEGN